MKKKYVLPIQGLTEEEIDKLEEDEKREEDEVDETKKENVMEAIETLLQEVSTI